MATVVLRPDSTIAITGGAVVGAGSAHAALSDNSDASYVSQTSTGDFLNVGLGTFVLPANSIVRFVTPRIRVNDIGYPLGGTSIVFVYSGAGDLVVSTELAGTPGFADVSGPAVDATYLTQAAIDGLTFILRRSNSSSNKRTSEIFLDVTYTAAPITAVTAPSGAVTTTSVPVVTWTYTRDPDGEAQSRYQVRVFSAAQYGAAGFNPETSTSVFDTGERYGGQLSTAVGPLPNATTYRAYVRTGQAIGSYVQYSGWAFSTFNIAVAAPAVSAISATPDSPNGRNRITVSRNVGGAAWTGVELQRSSDGGTTWQAVRGATNATPPGDVWIGYDYEAGNGVAVLYRARGLLSTGPVVGDWTTTALSVAWSAGVDWIKDLTNPARSMIVTVNTQPSVVRTRARGVFRPIGRPDPVIVSDVRQLVVGAMTVLTFTDDEADDLNDLLAADVVLFQARPGERFGSRYLAVGDVEEVRAGNVTDPFRVWSIPFVEVAAPVDDGLLVPGITWADVVATYATWTALGAAVLTWGDLV